MATAFRGTSLRAAREGLRSSDMHTVGRELSGASSKLTVHWVSSFIDDLLERNPRKGLHQLVIQTEAGRLHCAPWHHFRRRYFFSIVTLKYAGGTLCALMAEEIWRTLLSFRCVCGLPSAAILRIYLNNTSKNHARSMISSPPAITTEVNHINLLHQLLRVSTRHQLWTILPVSR